MISQNKPEYGFYIGEKNAVFTNCVSVCSYPSCHEVSTHYYIRGHSAEFWDMYEKSVYAKLESWVRDRVVVLGFCDNHGLATRTRNET